MASTEDGIGLVGAKKAKPRTRGSVAEETGEVDFRPVKVATVAKRLQMPEHRVASRLDTDGDGYVDQESEWEDARFAEEKSESLEVFQSFTGQDSEGKRAISGKTDVSEKQFVFLTILESLHEGYGVATHDGTPEGEDDDFLGVKEFIANFETRRLSVDRKSRKESVELFKGRMELQNRGDAAVQANGSPLKF